MMKLGNALQPNIEIAIPPLFMSERDVEGLRWVHHKSVVVDGPGRSGSTIWVAQHQGELAVLCWGWNVVAHPGNKEATILCVHNPLEIASNLHISPVPTVEGASELRQNDGLTPSHERQTRRAMTLMLLVCRLDWAPRVIEHVP